MKKKIPNQKTSTTLLRRFEQFIQQQEYDEASQVFNVLLRTFLLFDEKEKIQFLECGHALSRRALQCEQASTADAMYKSIESAWQNDALPLSDSIIGNYYQTVGEIYQQYDYFEQALDYFARTIHYAFDHGLTDVVTIVETRLDQLEISYFYREIMTSLSLMLREKELSELSHSDLECLMQQIKPIADGLAWLEEWEKIKILYDLLKPFTDRYLHDIDSQLSLAKQNTLDAFKKIVINIESIAQQFLTHRQHDISLKCYQIISQHAEKEAAEFTMEPILKNIATVYDYRESEQSPSVRYQSWRSEYQKELSNAREKVQKSLDSSFTVRSIQHDFTDDIKRLLTHFSINCEKLLGDAPCGFAFIGLGSFSRSELCPYSDIDCALLIADASFRSHAYFQRWIRLFKFKLDLLCENNPPGLHIDSGDMTYFFLQDMINTPEGFVKQYHPAVIDITQPEFYAIYHPSLLYANAKGGDLLARYQQLLQRELQSPITLDKDSSRPIHQHLAVNYLQYHQEQFHTGSHESTLQKINIKHHYLSPLLFWCHDIALYYGIFETNTSVVLQKLRDHHYIHSFFLNQIESALAFLQKLRIQSHLHAHMQQDEWTITGKHELDHSLLTLNESDFKRLQETIDYIIQPAYRCISAWQTDGTLASNFDPISHDFEQQLNACKDEQPHSTHSFKLAIKNLLLLLAHLCSPAVEYRTYYRRLPESMRQYFLASIAEVGIEEKRRKNICALLELYPQKNGLRISIEKNEKVWRAHLNELMLNADYQDSQGTHLKIIIESRLFGKQLLSPSFTKQLFDKRGQFKKKSLSGRHTVIRVQSGNIDFHFKLYPEFPGIEYAVHRLHELVVGQGTASSELVKLLFQGQVIPALVSKSISGVPLHKIDSEVWVDHLDHKQFSQLVLMSLLIHPEDGKPDNYILESYNDQEGKLRYRLIGVDNDHAFVVSLSKEGLLEKFRVKLHVKTIIYCIDKMKGPLHPEAIEEFLALAPDKVLFEWINELVIWDKEVKKLFTEQEIQDFSSITDDSKQLFIPILLREGLISELYQTMHRIQTLLRRNPSISAIDLLLHVEPMLGKYYQVVLNEDLTLEQRFRNLTYKEYKVLQDGSSQTTLNTLQTLQTMLGQIPNLKTFQKQTHLSPQHSLEELTVIKRQQNTLNMVRDELFNGKLLPFKALILESFKEQILNDIDFAALKTSQGAPNTFLQKSILQAMQETAFRSLVLKNCDIALDTKIFEAITRQSPHLISCRIINCSQTNKSAIRTLENHPVLEKIYLDHLTISQLDLTPRLFRGTAFPQLKRFTIKNSSQLTQFTLYAPNLEKLVIKNCLLLSQITLRTPKLKELYLIHCQSLTDAGLSFAISTCDALETLILTGSGNISRQELKEKVPFLARTTISDDKFLSIINGIISNSIHEASLKGEDMTEDKLQLLLVSLKRNESVKVLNLENTRLDNSGIQKLSDLLADTKTLQVLNLSHNKFTDASVAILADTLAINTSLTKLDLSYNQVKSRGALSLATALEKNLTLRKLDLLGNNIRNEGALHFIKAFKTNKTLRSLELLSVGIDGSIIELIKTALKYNQGLLGNKEKASQHIDKSPVQQTFFGRQSEMEKPEFSEQPDVSEKMDTHVVSPEFS